MFLSDTEDSVRMKYDLAKAWKQNSILREILSLLAKMNQDKLKNLMITLKSNDIIEDDPKVAELLEWARKVFKSGNKVAHEALEVSIRYFSQTIDDLENMMETKKHQKNIESKMDSLKTRHKKSEEIRKGDPPEKKEEFLQRRAM